MLSDPDLTEIEASRRASVAAEAVWQWLGKQDSDEMNRGKPWDDNALRVVLQLAPTDQLVLAGASGPTKAFATTRFTTASVVVRLTVSDARIVNG